VSTAVVVFWLIGLLRRIGRTIAREIADVELGYRVQYQLLESGLAEHWELKFVGAAAEDR
jgi:hypothetical protein